MLLIRQLTAPTDFHCSSKVNTKVAVNCLINHIL